MINNVRTQKKSVTIKPVMAKIKCVPSLPTQAVSPRKTQLQMVRSSNVCLGACEEDKCPADGADDQPQCTDDGCNEQNGKCTGGEHSGCDCKQQECPDPDKVTFWCSMCGGKDNNGNCKGVSELDFALKRSLS